MELGPDRRVVLLSEADAKLLSDWLREFPVEEVEERRVQIRQRMEALEEQAQQLMMSANHESRSMTVTLRKKAIMLSLACTQLFRIKDVLTEIVEPQPASDSVAGPDPEIDIASFMNEIQNFLKDK